MANCPLDIEKALLDEYGLLILQGNAYAKNIYKEFDSNNCTKRFYKSTGNPLT